MRSWLRWLRRRPVYVVVDGAEYQRMYELAVFGAAVKIVEDEQARWLLMDTEPSP